MMRREKLIHLVTAGIIERKGSRGKQHEKILANQVAKIRISTESDE